jgi:LCP family protein required for cell wall assembly
MDELAQLRDFRAGMGPPRDIVRERARRAWSGRARASGGRRWTDTRPGHRFGVRLVVALATATALVATAVVVVNHVIDQRVAEIPRVALGERVLEHVGSGHLPQNILILGVDDQSPGDDTAPRSDTTILLHVARHSARAVWFPRDLLVQIPGHPGVEPLDSAVSLGGPALAVETMKANFGVSVNHYVELDMRGMRDLVDAVGGVRMSFPDPLRDEYSGLHVPAGCVRLDGATALALARSRNAEALRAGTWQRVDLRSALDRDQRQQALVGALAATVRTLVDGHPQRVVRLLDAFVDHVALDDGFDRQDLARLARLFVGADATQLQTELLPAAISPHDPNRLALGAGSEVSVRQLGGSVTPAPATPAVPVDESVLRPC